MSVLCDLFVSTRDQALRYEEMQVADRTATLQHFRPAQFAGLTRLEFEILWAILADVEWDPDQHVLLEITSGEDDASWLCQFPDAFVALLVGLDGRAVQDATLAWGETEELRGAAADLRPVVDALVRLARQATAQNEALFLWGSL